MSGRRLLSLLAGAAAVGTLLFAAWKMLTVDSSPNYNTNTLISYPDSAFYQPAGEQQIDSPITPIPHLKPLSVELQQKVDLGRRLFSDTRLSGNLEVACTSCHIIPLGGHDPRTESIGISGKRLPRNSPTVLNAAFNISQFWDGRSPSLHDQVKGPLHNGDEMGGKIDEVIPLLNSDPEMVALFSIYPQGITLDTISDAISLYERTLITPNSPFDRYLLGDADAISESQKQGYALFVQLGCIICHQGRNVGGNLLQRVGVYASAEELEEKIGLDDRGRFDLTKDQLDSYVFKVPSLRNVARTATYFHDGSRKTLQHAIQDMGLLQLGQQLSESDTALLADFLESLNGEIQVATP